MHLCCLYKGTTCPALKAVLSFGWADLFYGHACPFFQLRLKICGMISLLVQCICRFSVQMILFIFAQKSSTDPLRYLYCFSISSTVSCTAEKIIVDIVGVSLSYRLFRRFYRHRCDVIRL